MEAVRPLLELGMQIDEIDLRAKLARCLCIAHVEAGRKLKLHVKQREAQNVSQ